MAGWILEDGGMSGVRGRVPGKARRRSRVVVRGRRAFYHVVSRVNGRAFLLTDGRKAEFRDLLRRVAGFCGVEVLTFCLMDNHFHLLISVPGEVGELDDKALLSRARLLYGKARRRQPLSYEGIERVLGQGGEAREAMRALLLGRMGSLPMFVKILKQRFSMSYNIDEGRTGTLWEGPFRSVLVEPSRAALSIVGAYIDLNPVRAGLVEDPKDYRFSGYGEAVGRGRPDSHELVRVLAQLASDRAEGLFERVGESRVEAMARAYRMLMFEEGATPKEQSGQGGKNARVLSRKVMREVLSRGGALTRGELLRCRVRYMTDGVILGSEGFVEAWFAEHRLGFGRRRTGARRLRGGGWGDLYCLRDLRKDVIG